jgi:hypothetical protein
VTAFAEPLDIVFPASLPSSAIPAYSTDGKTWTAIPKLPGTTLPNGWSDGWYWDAQSSLHVLTLHATYYGMLKKGSKTAQALTLTLTAARPLNLTHGDRLTARLRSTFPGQATATLLAAGKSIAAQRITLTGKPQTLTLTLPPAARRSGSGKLTVHATAISEHASATVAITTVKTNT